MSTSSECFLFHLRSRVSQIPRCPLEARIRTALDPPDRRPIFVIHHEIKFRLRLLCLGPQLIVRRIGNCLVLLRRLLLRVLPFLLFRLDLLSFRNAVNTAPYGEFSAA